MIRRPAFLSRVSVSLVALCLALPAIATAQSAQDFQLPPNPTPTPTGPQVQGPVDEEVPAPASPAATPTAQNTPTPQATQTPAPQLQVTPTPSRPRATPAATTRPTPQRSTPAAQRTTPASPTTRATPDIGIDETQSTAPDASPDMTQPAPALPTSVPTDTAPQAEADEGEAGFPWVWLAALAALLAAIAGFVFWRRKQADAPPALIEPPKVGKPTAAADTSDDTAEEEPPVAVSAAPDAVVSATGSADWLKVEARVSELQRSMMTTALYYKLVIANRSGSVLENIVVEADLATAHNRLPVGEQLASPETPLTVRETIARLSPGERIELECDIRIPLSDVKIITQGKALLCVPLLRLRVTDDAKSRNPIARTWVVGRTNQESQGKLNPFRFDAPPQNYSDIGQRALD